MKLKEKINIEGFSINLKDRDSKKGLLSDFLKALEEFKPMDSIHDYEYGLYNIASKIKLGIRRAYRIDVEVKVFYVDNHKLIIYSDSKKDDLLLSFIFDRLSDNLVD